MNGVETIVDTYRRVEDKYVFDFNNIAPDKMNDTVYATLYADYNGTEYASETREYSIATYCYTMLEKYSSETYSEFRTLLVDLLNYGACSQTYTGYKTDTLVNAVLTPDQQAWATEARTPNTVMNQGYETIDNPTVTWKGAGLVLKDRIEMRFKIEPERLEGLTAKITTENDGEWIIPASQFVQNPDNSKQYYIYFKGLNAGQMSEPVYVTIYNGDTAVSNTIRYSIESYAYAHMNTTDANLKELLIAMMKYGDAAKAYITE